MHTCTLYLPAIHMHWTNGAAHSLQSDELAWSILRAQSRAVRVPRDRARCIRCYFIYVYSAFVLYIASTRVMTRKYTLNARYRGAGIHASIKADRRAREDCFMPSSLYRALRFVEIYTRVSHELLRHLLYVIRSFVCIIRFILRPYIYRQVEEACVYQRCDVYDAVAESMPSFTMCLRYIILLIACVSGNRGRSRGGRSFWDKIRLLNVYYRYTREKFAQAYI